MVAILTILPTGGGGWLHRDEPVPFDMKAAVKFPALNIRIIKPYHTVEYEIDGTPPFAGRYDQLFLRKAVCREQADEPTQKFVGMLRIMRNFTL